ncbi:MAG: iron-sulfur cluster co-chaperone HscB C-terminal domain-containing protein [Alphaproteobacteria bacterium]|nr:iron-sulfur cluster co-chaperone HscB C-terminal domain-containing protein [Alphaproteobacteria bacterium]
MTNYFEILNIAPALFIDDKQLKKHFLLKQRETHPDQNVFADANKQLDLLNMSALSNKAYKSLSNFSLRLAHLLEIYNVVTDLNKEEMSPEFLMDMMEFNETLELEADIDVRVKLIDEQLAYTMHDLEKFKLVPIESLKLEDWELLKQKYFELKYLSRIKDNFGK